VVLKVAVVAVVAAVAAVVGITLAVRGGGGDSYSLKTAAANAAEADKVASEHALPVDILFARWNQLCEKAGKTVPFAEAAKSVNADLKRGLTKRQVAANSAVKAPLKLKGGGSSSRPTFAPPTTDEGIRQRLKAAGHDIS
jgi:hypothetical protein